MDMEQIECFLAVSRYSSYSKASQEISLSQSSISKKILALESELGIKVFDRSTHEVKLTRAGQLLAEYGEQLLQTYNLFLDELKKDHNVMTCKLVIGSIYFSPKGAVMPVIAKFSRLHPDIQIEIIRDTSIPLVGKLLNYEIDIAFVSNVYPSNYRSTVPNFSQDDRLISFSISKEPYCLAVGKGHRLATRPYVDYQDIKNEKFIEINRITDVYHRAVKTIFDYENIVPDIVAICNDAHDAISLVSHNVGITFLSPQVTADRDDIVLIPLKNPPIKDLQVVIRKEKEIPSYIKLFFNFIKHEFK